MVPNICQSRLHLIPTHVFVLVLFNLFFNVISIISAVNDAGQRVCSAGYCTNTTKISELNKLCNSLGISNLSLVDTKYSLDMKLDFCIDAFPFGLLLSKNSYGILDFTNSSCKFEIPEFVSCGDIKDIHEKDLTIKGYHDAYVDILDRSEFNLQNQNETETELCKVS